MTMKNIFGADGEPVRCKVVSSDIFVHWFDTFAVIGDKCLCGMTEKSDAEAELTPPIGIEKLRHLTDGLLEQYHYEELQKYITSQVEAVLDRLHHEYYEVDEDSLDTLIEAERNKLKESK